MAKIWETKEWADLTAHVAEVEKTHLRELLKASCFEGGVSGAVRGGGTD
jgi:hypothetical protein